jgi:hypothetical protein
MQLSDPSQGLWVEGSVQDHLSLLSRARVNLAALRYGAGIKGKILDGWSVGTPCVTTPIGAEGMTDGLAWGGKIGLTPSELIRAMIELDQNESQWNLARQAGMQVVAQVYSSSVSARIADDLARVQRDRSSLRRTNLVGEMLWRDQTRCTEYFSRWIELKEQLRRRGLGDSPDDPTFDPPRGPSGSLGA